MTLVKSQNLKVAIGAHPLDKQKIPTSVGSSPDIANAWCHATNLHALMSR
jgi:hypothetical protein